MYFVGKKVWKGESVAPETNLVAICSTKQEAEELVCSLNNYYKEVGKSARFALVERF